MEINTVTYAVILIVLSCSWADSHSVLKAHHFCLFESIWSHWVGILLFQDLYAGIGAKGNGFPETTSSPVFWYCCLVDWLCCCESKRTLYKDAQNGGCRHFSNDQIIEAADFKKTISHSILQNMASFFTVVGTSPFVVKFSIERLW